MTSTPTPSDRDDLTPARVGTSDAYLTLRRDALALVDGESDWLANLANLAALVYERMDGLNWAGFYLMRGDELVLGPFQGLPACTRIFFGRGVCGTAAKKGETVVVRDVDNFEGHIACDSDSKSEIVVPLFKHDALFGVLDIDSPVRSRFDETDRAFLEKAAGVIVDKLR